MSRRPQAPCLGETLPMCHFSSDHSEWKTAHGMVLSPLFQFSTVSTGFTKPEMSLRPSKQMPPTPALNWRCTITRPGSIIQTLSPRPSSKHMVKFADFHLDMRYFTKFVKENSTNTIQSNGFNKFKNLKRVFCFNPFLGQPSADCQVSSHFFLT